MRGYGERHFEEDTLHKIPVLPGIKGETGPLVVVFYATPFDKRVYRRLTTNKAAARRANRAACNETF